MSPKNVMIVRYSNGEERRLEVPFEAHDLEAFAVPIFASVVIETLDDKQIMINMDKVQEIEFIIEEVD